jgi:hypothetical protein
VERDLTRTLRDALELAHHRGRRLARVVVRGAGVDAGHARGILDGLGHEDVEIVVVADAGPVRLGAVELMVRGESLTPVSEFALVPK